MSIRKTIVALALVGGALPAAFASNGTTWMGSDRGFEPHPGNSSSTKTRTEVMQELQAFRNNPVTADGGKIVDTERGIIPAQHSYAFQGGALVHTDKLAHDTAKPSLVMTDADKRLQRELYRR
jgi:hypothetical protein